MLSYAAELGAQVDWVVDAGVSARDGYNLKFGRIAQLRADILSGKRAPGILMIDEQTRLSRASLFTTIGFLSPLLEAGTALAVAQRKQVLRANDDAALFGLFAFLAESQGAHRDNERRISQVSAETAIRRGNLKTGVVYNSRVPDWCKCRKSRCKGDFKRDITPIPERARLVVEIFELTAAGYGSQRLAKLFNDRARTDPRYTPWRGQGWTPNVISNLTANRRVIGELQPHRITRRPGAVGNPNTKHKRAPIQRIPDGPLRKDHYPVVVSMDLWDRAQASKARNAKTKSGRPSRENVNLFSGLCRCGSCGDAMHLRGHNLRGKQDRLVCAGSLRGVCTNNVHYSLTRLEHVFLRVGFTMLSKASDFTQGNAAASTLAAELDRAKQRVQQALDGLNNVRALMKFAGSDSERAVVMAQITDETRSRDAALEDRDRIERALAEARGDDPEEATLRGELLANDAKAGSPEARVALSAILRAVIARVDFEAGCAFITPSRPALALPLADEDGVVVPTSTDRPARRLVAELGQYDGGRRRLIDEVPFWIEGMDSRKAKDRPQKAA